MNMLRQDPRTFASAFAILITAAVACWEFTAESFDPAVFSDRNGSEPAESLSSIHIPFAEEQPRYFHAFRRGVTTGISYRDTSWTGAIFSKLEGIPDAAYQRSRSRSVLNPTFRAGGQVE
jgi:hypothetical protein